MADNNTSDSEHSASLFAARENVYPAAVKGKFRNIKWALMALFLGIYYLTPLIRWDRGPAAPDQAVLLDLANRKFYFFFIELWPQDVIYFTGILLLAALALFFFTALFGRVWCGYACFQTVWTDLFMLVERWVEGDRNARKRLDDGPLNFNKIWRKVAKHAAWIFIALCTGGAWVFYFSDAPTLWQNLWIGEASFAAIFWMCFLAFGTYVMAGHAREQVCTYMCPYARFQGAMFDENTLIVSYDEKRGEPRGKKGQSTGDCVDCDRCVAVCPTGIDIRDGQQYQCINCALCIDACNEIMDKLKRPRGLIRYNTLDGGIKEGAGFKEIAHATHMFRPRTIFYTFIMLAVGLLMLYGITLGRTTLDIHAIRDRNPLYVQMSDGGIRNGYTVRIVNKVHETKVLTLSVDGIQDALVSLSSRKGEAAKTLQLEVKPNSVGEYRIFVTAPKGKGSSGKTPVIFHVKNGEISDSYDTVFIAP